MAFESMGQNANVHGPRSKARQNILHMRRVRELNGRATGRGKIFTVRFDTPVD
jgi:hypothetical protein